MSSAIEQLRNELLAVVWRYSQESDITVGQTRQAFTEAAERLRLTDPNMTDGDNPQPALGYRGLSDAECIAEIGKFVGKACDEDVISAVERSFADFERVNKELGDLIRDQQYIINELLAAASLVRIRVTMHEPHLAKFSEWNRLTSAMRSAEEMLNPTAPEQTDNLP